MALDGLLQGMTPEQARMACGNGKIERAFSFLAKLAKLINPQNRDISLFYPLSGADISTALYVANPARVLMLDMLPLTQDNSEIPASVDDGEDFERIFVSDSNFFDEYSSRIMPRGSSFNGTLGGYLEPFVMAQLAVCGVDITKIVRSYGEPSHLNFSWKHPNEQGERQRKIHFREGTFTGTEDIPREFDAMLVKSGIDIAVNFAARGQALKKGGMLLADDWMKLPSSMLYDLEPLPKAIIDEYKGLNHQGYVFGLGLPPHLLIRK